MRRFLSKIHDPQNERLALLTDAVGTIALFVLLGAGLYAPLIA